jgi:uncharacterized protein (DUF302 family)
MKYFVVFALVALVSWVPPANAADSIGIFETILESSISFEETTAALESAIAESELQLHASHVVRVPDDMQQAKVYVLTSPTYADAAASESPRTVSAQVLRIAVYTMGDEKKAYVNMANPIAHAMVYYSESSNYDTLVTAATAVAADIRAVVAAVPGNAVSRPLEPMRTEKKYRKFNGDGPAKMMAKFRNWDESQLLIDEAPAGDFESTVDKVATTLATGIIANAEECEGWEVITRIDLRDDAVYFGLSNPYIEDKMVRINSRFRKDGKTDLAPYPGVDHMTALPTEVLIVKDGDKTKVLHYGQMWRMQLYFWDSGYRAFTANMGVPGTISDSIEEAISH